MYNDNKLVKEEGKEIASGAERPKKKSYNSKKKELAKSAGPHFRKGFSKGDLLKHKAENLRLRMEK